ncbi:hypothetical protein [Leifsonia sp. PS1209]|uniref:hypothetical protein n=1 Tax=Leifsonia sp. PS1209 TaxID=2724914 RepID=UPI001442AE65|nr:hypothetical protein [Leifsonia sp. PS1209]QIZ99853.1 hypothetical protein HF024_15960 [Leifsonia sp. PS1209]
MSTFKHPVGPQPSTVYWRRRLILALGVIAVIVVVVLIVVRPGSSQGTPTPAATNSKPATPGADGTNIPTENTTASGQPCKPANVKVTANTDASTYAAGELPKLTVSITNTGTVSCKIDAGTAQQVFTITSGTETYWKSTDCQSDKVDAEVLLQPGKTVSSQTPIEWDRTRSDPATCQQTREQVPAGGASYHLTTSVSGIESAESKQFILD